MEDDYMIGILIFTIILIGAFTYYVINKTELYIRIGEIPEDEISKIYRGDAVIGEENGVSVYNAVNINNIWHIVMPYYFKEGQGQTYEALIQNVTECRFKVNEPQKVYLVSGKKVGYGTDGEPVIKNVVIKKDLTEQFRKYQISCNKTIDDLNNMQMEYNELFNNYIVKNE